MLSLYFFKCSLFCVMFFFHLQISRNYFRPSIFWGHWHVVAGLHIGYHGHRWWTDPVSIWVWCSKSFTRAPLSIYQVLLLISSTIYMRKEKKCSCCMSWCDAVFFTRLMPLLNSWVSRQTIFLIMDKRQSGISPGLSPNPGGSRYHNKVLHL